MVTTQLSGCGERQSRSGHSPARRTSRLRATSCMSVAGLVGSGGSDPTAACGRLRKGSEWPRSARSKHALSCAASAGHRNRRWLDLREQGIQRLPSRILWVLSWRDKKVPPSAETALSARRLPRRCAPRNDTPFTKSQFSKFADLSICALFFRLLHRLHFLRRGILKKQTSQMEDQK